MTRLKSNKFLYFKVPMFPLGVFDDAVKLYKKGKFKPTFRYTKCLYQDLNKFRNKYPLAIQLS